MVKLLLSCQSHFMAIMVAVCMCITRFGKMVKIYFTKRADMPDLAISRAGI